MFLLLMKGTGNLKLCNMKELAVQFVSVIFTQSTSQLNLRGTENLLIGLTDSHTFDADLARAHLNFMSGISAKNHLGRGTGLTITVSITCRFVCILPIETAHISTRPGEHRVVVAHTVTL